MNDSKDAVYARETAYDTTKATEYDAFRFSDRAGKTIHDKERARLFDALSRIPAGGKVLEVGCGTGRLLVEAASKGFEVDGADASGPMLAEAEAKFSGAASGRKPTFMICGANSIPVDDDSYDLAYCIRLLNQTESPEYALTVVEELARVTKPGGYFLTEFVNEHRPRLGKNRRPTTRLRPQDVIATARRAGSVEETWSGAFFVSMQAYQKAGSGLVSLVSGLDGMLSSAMPRLCSRVYLLARKRSA